MQMRFLQSSFYVGDVCIARIMIVWCHFKLTFSYIIYEIAIVSSFFPFQWCPIAPNENHSLKHSGFGGGKGIMKEGDGEE